MRARTVQHGRSTYVYNEMEQLVAIDAPIRAREWCVEHWAPPARFNESPWRQCIDLVRRLRSGSIYDEPYDCQIVPNLALDEVPN